MSHLSTSHTSTVKLSTVKLNDSTPIPLGRRALAWGLAWLLTLAVLLTGLSFAVWGPQWMRHVRSATATSAPVQGRDAIREDASANPDEAAPTLEEEKHESNGDDVLVRIER